MTEVIVEGPGSGRIWIREHPAKAVAVVAVVLLAVWLVLRLRGPAEEAAAETSVVAATTETVRVEAFAIRVAAIGTVEPEPGAEARVAAPAQTRVTSIHVA